MEPKVPTESVRMLPFLGSSGTCRSRAKQYADAMASMARLGHPYIYLSFTRDASKIAKFCAMMLEVPCELLLLINE
jgi:hypothetical protein